MTDRQPIDEEISAGGVVIRRGSEEAQLIVAEQRDWNTQALNVRLPKGHLESGESLEEAALREVLEEVGVQARILRPLAPVRYQFRHEKAGRSIAKVVYFFLMEHVEGEARPADGEMERPFWCGFDEALTQLTFESERAVVQEARSLLASEGPPSTEPP